MLFRAMPLVFFFICRFRCCHAALPQLIFDADAMRDDISAAAFHHNRLYARCCRCAACHAMMKIIFVATFDFICHTQQSRHALRR